MAEPRFDPTLYARLPPLDVETAVALGCALASAAPALPPEAEEALHLVERATDALHEAHADEGNVRVPDARGLERAWTALHARLSACAALPGDRAGQALELRDVVFPDGTAFLLAPAPQAWADATHRLDLVDQAGLAGALESLCGKDFLDLARESCTHLAEDLGADLDGGDGANQAALLARFRLSLVRYAMTVAAGADPEDAESVEWATSALAPLDAVRAGRPLDKEG